MSIHSHTDDEIHPIYTFTALGQTCQSYRIWVENKKRIKQEAKPCSSKNQPCTFTYLTNPSSFASSSSSVSEPKGLPFGVEPLLLKVALLSLSTLVNFDAVPCKVRKRIFIVPSIHPTRYGYIRDDHVAFDKPTIV